MFELLCISCPEAGFPIRLRKAVFFCPVPVGLKMTADNQKRRDELSFFLTLTPLPPPLLLLSSKSSPLALDHAKFRFVLEAKGKLNKMRVQTPNFVSQKKLARNQN